MGKGEGDERGGGVSSIEGVQKWGGEGQESEALQSVTRIPAGLPASSRAGASAFGERTGSSCAPQKPRLPSKARL